MNAAHPDLADALHLPDAPLTVQVVLLPRFARRLRALAYARGRTPERVASRLLAEALVPDADERVRLIARDCRGVLPDLVEARHGE